MKCNIHTIKKYFCRRMLSTNIITRSSKLKNLTHNITIDNEYVSASSIKNYILDDTLSDWIYYFFNKFECKKNIDSNIENRSITKKRKFDEINKENSKEVEYNLAKKRKIDNISFIQTQGYEFEYFILDKIKERFPNKVKQIAYTPHDSKSVNKYNETIECIKKGVPFIYQAVLHNNKNKTFGIPDLLVRSDYIKYFYTTNIEDTDGSKEEFIDPNSGFKWTYRVIDIKYSTIKLSCNQNYILNSAKHKYYKSQICIYNEALGYTQKYIPDKAYILAFKYSYTKNRIRTVLDWDEMLAPINFMKKDNFVITSTNSAIKWVKYVKKYGHQWNPYKPHIIELIPNLKSIYNKQYYSIKMDIISKTNNNITELWKCSYKHMLKSLQHNIISWKHQDCNSAQLGIGGKNAEVLDLIIEMNQDMRLFSDNYLLEPEFKSLLTPNKIKNNLHNWQNILKQNEICFYVDFETINKTVLNKNNFKSPIFNDDIIFMIGVGYIKPNTNKWKYKCFYIKELTYKDEKKCINKFLKYIYNIQKNANDTKNINIFHWGCHEPISLNKKLKHPIYQTTKITKYTDNIIWIDGLKIFKNEPIVVRNALNFSIKTIAKAFYKNGFIKTSYDSNMVSNGLNAMVLANNIYNSDNLLTKKALKKNPLMKEVMDYNEIDCKVIWEIFQHLKNNHI